MDLFLGKWIEKKDVHFGKFLKFSKVPWFHRQIVEHSKIKIIIERWKNVHIKTVSSQFYNTEEVLKLDDEYRDSDKSSKKFRIEDNIVYVTVKCDNGICWEEEIFIKDDFLVTKYIWTEDDQKKLAVQFFKRN